MIEIGTVYGSKEQAVPLVIGYDTVYVHTNIEPVTEDKGGNPIEGWFKYQEVQYNKNEYILMMAETNAALSQQVTDAQLALAELYEMMPV